MNVAVLSTTSQIRRFGGDLWVGITTTASVVGLADQLRTAILDCGSIFTPQSGSDRSTIVASAWPKLGDPSPTRANVTIYASPNSDRDLFRGYAVAQIIRNRIQISDANTLNTGVITYGEFVPLDGFSKQVDAFTFDYAINFFISSGVVLGLMLVVEGMRAWDALINRKY